VASWLEGSGVKGFDEEAELQRLKENRAKRDELASGLTPAGWDVYWVLAKTYSGDDSYSADRDRIHDLIDEQSLPDRHRLNQIDKIMSSEAETLAVMSRVHSRSVDRNIKQDLQNEEMKQGCLGAIVMPAIVGGVVWLFFGPTAGIVAAIAMFFIMLLGTGEALERIEKSVPSTSSVGGPATRHVPQAVKIAVANRDNGRCVRCGRSEDIHFDHVTPFSRGGSSRDASNIQLLCGRCNRAKGNRYIG
jgi:uncharacterized membrane protein